MFCSLKNLVREEISHFALILHTPKKKNPTKSKKPGRHREFLIVKNKSIMLIVVVIHRQADAQLIKVCTLNMHRLL